MRTLKDWKEHRPKSFEFKGRFIKNWFSNMEPSPLPIGGHIWPSVENYFQAMKTFDKSEQAEILVATPQESKRLGRKVKLRPDWEQVKEKVMETALLVKFMQEPYKTLLIETGDSMIIEWNNWGDKEWGVDINTNEGNNKLGLILMKIRKSLTE